MQQLVAGVAGMDPQAVYPRWQVEPQNYPAGDWAAVGVTTVRADAFAYEFHNGAAKDANGNIIGATIVQRHERIELLCSFYGRYGGGADLNAKRFRDGLSVPQNREALQLAGMGLVEVGPAIAVPELIKGKWLYRVDSAAQFNRIVRRTYPVLNIIGLVGALVIDGGPPPIALKPHP
jgi:hypothetical protein